MFLVIWHSNHFHLRNLLVSSCLRFLFCSYGYSNFRYVSSLISGVGIFCVGAGFAWYHGIAGVMGKADLVDMRWVKILFWCVFTTYFPTPRSIFSVFLCFPSNFYFMSFAALFEHQCYNIKLVFYIIRCGVFCHSSQLYTLWQAIMLLGGSLVSESVTLLMAIQNIKRKANQYHQTPYEYCKLSFPVIHVTSSPPDSKCASLNLLLISKREFSALVFYGFM